MRPMAAPVLGGILVADEVIDLLLPVLFYIVRKRRWQRAHARTAMTNGRSDHSAGRVESPAHCE
jgi:hypothetical protein